MVSGTSRDLRQLIAAGADDRLLDRYIQAKACGDLVTAKSILSELGPSLNSSPPIGHDDPLQRVRVAALRPYVNSLDPAGLQGYLRCMLDVSGAVVAGLDGRALWDVPGVVDAVAEVVRDASVNHLRRCSPGIASVGKTPAQSAHPLDDASVGHGLLDEAQFAARLGWTVDRVDRALSRNSIFAVSIAGARYFPPFLADLSYSRRHLSAVCRLLGTLPGPSKLQFFSTPKGSLGGDTPLEALLKRRFAAVRVAAQGYVVR